MEIHYKHSQNVGSFTRLCRTDGLLLKWPEMNICKNTLEQRVSARITLFAHLWRIFPARLKRR